GPLCGLYANATCRYPRVARKCFRVAVQPRSARAGSVMPKEYDAHQAADVAAASSRMSMPQPPIAPRRDHLVESPHGNRTDPYYWLRDDERSNPEVIQHLEAENAYTEALLAPGKALIDDLYREIVARLKPDESSAP